MSRELKSDCSPIHTRSNLHELNYLQETTDERDGHDNSSTGDDYWRVKMLIYNDSINKIRKTILLVRKYKNSEIFISWKCLYVPTEESPKGYNFHCRNTAISAITQQAILQTSFHINVVFIWGFRGQNHECLTKTQPPVAITLTPSVTNG